MTETGDGIDESLTTTTTVAVTAAARAGEQLARMREQSQRAVQAQAEQSGQHLTARLAAEQQAAAAYFAAVSQPDYLDHASAQDLAEAHRQAVAWRDTDAGAARAVQLLAERHRQRFGTHPTGNETAKTVALVTGADAAAHQATDTHQETAGQQQQTDSPQWDGRERRAQLADTLRATVDNPAAVQARITADTANAHPPQDAVRPGVGRAGSSPGTPPTPGRALSPGLER